MLNFKRSFFSFIATELLLLALHLLADWALFWLLLPPVCFSILLVWGASSIASGFFVSALCRGTANERWIAISFDDGPNPAYTPPLLQLLKTHQVPASFFLIGKNIAGNEQLLRQMNAEGHTIGNHTFSHSFFIDFSSAKKFEKEIKDTDNLIFEIIRKRPAFFRPPYGVTTPHLATACKRLNKTVIGWNIRSMDTTKDAREKIEDRIRTNCKPGSILLFHDSSEKTLKIVESTLIFAKENGFKIVSLDQLLSIPAYA